MIESYVRTLYQNSFERGMDYSKCLNKKSTLFFIKHNLYRTIVLVLDFIHGN